MKDDYFELKMKGDYFELKVIILSWRWLFWVEGDYFELMKDYHFELMIVLLLL